MTPDQVMALDNLVRSTWWVALIGGILGSMVFTAAKAIFGAVWDVLDEARTHAYKRAGKHV